MPLRLTYNPYQGINAHANSFLQSPQGGWEAFHAEFLTDLKRVINPNLPDGYYAITERALVIRDDEDDYLHTTYPDVGLAISPPYPSETGGGLATLEAPTLELTLEELEHKRYAKTVKIYDAKLGQLVTRLELLSPSNKIDPEGFLAMRREMLAGRVNLIEIDFLHEQPNLFEALPNYSDDDPRAYPYCITILNPQIDRARFYAFRVDDPLPVLTLPLRGEDTVRVDFGAAYNTTFADDRRAHMAIDYAEVPANFKSYSPIDQARIRTVMANLTTAE